MRAALFLAILAWSVSVSHAWWNPLPAMWRKLGYFDCQSMHDAIGANDLPLVKKIIGRNPELVSCPLGDIDDLPLHIAARRGARSIVAALINGRANVDGVNAEKQTALHIAAISVHIDVVKDLIDNKANINAIDIEMNTPLMLALRVKRNIVATCLLDAGADATLKNKDGKTAREMGDSIPEDIVTRLEPAEETPSVPPVLVVVLVLGSIAIVLCIVTWIYIRYRGKKRSAFVLNAEGTEV